MALSRSSRRPFAASSHAGQAVLILACREKEREREIGIKLSELDRSFYTHGCTTEDFGVEGVWRLLTKNVPAGMIM